MDRFPAEILHMIFRKIEPRKSSTFALVCKAWKDPAMEVFYTNVEFISTSQMKKFLETIKHKPHLGNIVKTLQISYISWRNSIEDFKHYTSLLYNSLPNLEAIKEGGTHTYELIKNALTDSKLTRLKKLPDLDYSRDKVAISNYIDCALLLTDRLETVYIGESKDQQTNLDIQRLYNSLDQFDKLIQVKIKKLINDELPILEYVSEKCKSVKEITFDSTSPQNWTGLQQRQDTITTDAISKYVPSIVIKKLKASFNSDHGYEVLPYIMHKFPQLDEVSLSFGGEYGPAKYDINTASQLIDYISRIEEFHIQSLKLNQINITETIASLWEARCKPGQQRLEIGYSEQMSDDKKVMLDLSSYDSFFNTRLIYTNRDFDWDLYEKFIEKSGKYIGDLEFDVTIGMDDYDCPCVLPGNFLAHIFTHCPNLRSLSLQTCILNQIEWKGFGDNEKISIEKLDLEGCNVSGVYEQLSERFSDIKQFDLGYVGYSPSDGKRSVPDVNMPYTNINTISVYFFSDHDVIYVKVLDSSDKSQHFYRYTYHSLKASTEQEYEAVNRDQHIYICCQNKPKIQFRMAP